MDDQNELKLTLSDPQNYSTDLSFYLATDNRETPELTPDNQVLISEEASNNTFLFFTTLFLTQSPKIKPHYSSSMQDDELTTDSLLTSETSKSDNFMFGFSDYNFDNTTTNASMEIFNTTYLPENFTSVNIYNHSVKRIVMDYNDDTDLDYNDERFIMNLFPNDSTTTLSQRNTGVSFISSTEVRTTTYEDISTAFEDYEATNDPTETANTIIPFVEMTENPVYKKRLRSLCWETMFGQELVKLTVMDLILTILYIMVTDFFRAIFVRYMNKCWCWDLEKKFPQYGDFKVAENILHLVNNQGMVWMGMFFSPGLIVLNVLKLFIIMYLRSWAVLTCNVPHEVLFRASRSNNFYYALLLMMLFLCVLPVGYAIVWIKPSEYCGPFSTCIRIYHIFTKTIRRNLPKSFYNTLEYIASPGIVIPLLLLLILIIYYFVSLTTALREANEDLKVTISKKLRYYVFFCIAAGSVIY